MTSMELLKQRTADIVSLQTTSAVLEWDQQTQMPPAGTARRASQLALLKKLSHDMFISSQTEQLLVAAEGEAEALDPDSDDSAFIKVVRRDFDKAAKLPTKLVEEIASTGSLANEQWQAARAQSNYAKFAPWLEKTLDLQRQVANHLGFKDERYDALLDLYEPEMSAAAVRTMFGQIKPPLVKLVKQIVGRGPDFVDTEPLTRECDEEKQRTFNEMVIKAFGFDFTRGRQDRAVHPFCTSFSNNDVRITTRYDSHFLPSALFGSLHETGHALYEMGVAGRYDGNMLQGGVSLGIHESQSRLWENLVGRSRGFWTCFYPQLQSQFPALGDVTLDAFYKAINRVKPSLIRVEADEITYNLHILLRFEIEIEMLEGRLSVADAPAAWNAKCEEYLGLTPANDAEGILQDVHWSWGAIGYFPTYSLGNVISVQLFEAASHSLGGEVPAQIERGEFAPLREWMSTNIYQWGRKYTPVELVQRSTSRSIDTTPYINYLTRKFGEIYKL